MVKFFAAFNIPDLDKKATLTPIRPKEGALNRVSVYIFTVLVELSESRLWILQTNYSLCHVRMCCFVLQTIPPLSAAEEAQLEKVLNKIREQVNERRIMMYQYFKDYDRVRF